MPTDTSTPLPRLRAPMPYQGAVRRICRPSPATCLRWVELTDSPAIGPATHRIELLDGEGRLAQLHITRDYDVADAIYVALANGRSLPAR